MRRFRDREEAGSLLGQMIIRCAETGELEGIHEATGSHDIRGLHETLVLALPRGGVPVGYEVACALKAPLEIFLVRKLGLPGNAELAMGAIASGGSCVLNQDLIENLDIPPELLRSVIQSENEVLKAREIAYGVHDRKMDFSHNTIVLVDDGAATGATMRVAVRALRQKHVPRIIVGLPAASSQAADQLREDADKVITVIESDYFQSVGQWYEHFNQTTDEEVLEFLQRAADRFKPATKSG